MDPNSSSDDNIRHHIDTIINKSFLILDQIHESYFPFLEKSIYLSMSTNSMMIEKIDKAKISKTEFIIQQRIKYVIKNCEQLEVMLTKLSANNSSRTDLSNRLNQLRSEQKRIWSAFKAIQLKRLEKERLQKEQEESLTRRFITTNTSSSSSSSTTTATTNQQKQFSNLNKNCGDHHQCSNHQHLTLNIDNGDDNDNQINDQYSPTSKDKILSSSSTLATSLTLSSSSSGSKLLRNQRPLVKRVRTRYLNFLTNDFFGSNTKSFLRLSLLSSFSSFAEWILLLALCLIFIGLFLLIIWQTSLTTTSITTNNRL